MGDKYGNFLREVRSTSRFDEFYGNLVAWEDHRDGQARDVNDTISTNIPAARKGNPSRIGNYAHCIRRRNDNRRNGTCNKRSGTCAHCRQRNYIAAKTNPTEELVSNSTTTPFLGGKGILKAR